MGYVTYAVPSGKMLRSIRQRDGCRAIRVLVTALRMRDANAMWHIHDFGDGINERVGLN